MNDFTFYNPTRVVLGRGTLQKIDVLIPRDATVLLLYGSGSIKRNGVFGQVVAGLGARVVIEQGGILPNPTDEQCGTITEAVRQKGITFILAVGGGSVIDAGKCVAAAMRASSSSAPWELIEKRIAIESAVPLGVVLTIPASGSEMNANAVLSNTLVKAKRTLKGEAIYPRFAILDPDVTKSLSPRQIANGVVDAYSHVLEQYLTFPSNAPLQDRFAEGILSTLIELAPGLVKGPFDYDSRASFMWATSSALNGYISVGVPQDWSTHWIAHELTAEYGIAHAESIAVVLPGVLSYMREQKKEKLIQYGRRVLGLSETPDHEIPQRAVDLTEEFFVSLGQGVRLSDIGLGPEAAKRVSKKVAGYPFKIGEKRNIGEREVREILLMRV